MRKTLRIATRESALALWQANYVRDALISAHPALDVEILGFTTEGDRNQHSSLKEIGGKGLFVKELEQALLNNVADVAVHSMKDVPALLPAGLEIAVVSHRVDPRDALVTNGSTRLEALADDARIGTSSLRRRLQLQARFPNLAYLDLRGNVDTRLRKLDAGDYDGVILATAGLQRLGFAHRITELIDVSVCLPAAGQGALGIECRSDDEDVMELIAVLNHAESHQCVTCERTVTNRLEADCSWPIAVHATLEGDQFELQAFISDEQGLSVCRESGRGSAAKALDIASDVADRLISAGARSLIGGA